MSEMHIGNKDHHQNSIIQYLAQSPSLAKYRVVAARQCKSASAPPICAPWHKHHDGLKQIIDKPSTDGREDAAVAQQS